MKPMGPLDKIAARVNRSASGAAPGRTETDSRATMRENARPGAYTTTPHRAPNGMPAGSKASGAIGEAIDQRVANALKKAGV